MKKCLKTDCDNLHNKKGKFCSYSCSNSRKPTKETIEKLRIIAKNNWIIENANPDKSCLKANNSQFWTEERRENQRKLIGNAIKSKSKKAKPKNLFELSKRTISKILKRLSIGCSRCGWNKGTCDLHHINGRVGEDMNGHWNLTYICPNCHREFHSGNKSMKNEFISLDNFIGDKWLDVYYG